MPNHELQPVSGASREHTLVAMHEAKSGRISYNSLSTKFLHGVEMPSWIVVSERNRKASLDIALHVLSATLRDEHGRLDPQRLPLVDQYDLRPSYPEYLPSEDYSEQMIPLSTLPEDELKDVHHFLPDHPLLFEDTRRQTERNTWCSAVRILLGELCVVDSIETRVFPRVAFGSKIRIGSRDERPILAGSLQQYCLKTLPTNDEEMRRLTRNFIGNVEVEAGKYLAASAILESAHDSFLQLRPVNWAIMGGNLKM